MVARRLSTQRAIQRNIMAGVAKRRAGSSATVPDNDSERRSTMMPEWKGPYWEPRDIWVGIYWNFERRSRMRHLDVYIILVPCFPIRLTWRERP